jgi:hypothetical protein
MTYKIACQVQDSTGTIVSQNTPEGLGDAYGVSYATEEEAQDVADALAADLPEGYETAEYFVYPFGA